jgi:peptidyl-prolyl cis-trans isomerase A (cyclophilin A)
MALPIERRAPASLLGRIWELRRNFTAYGAACVALAEETGSTLFTCDSELAKGHDAEVVVFRESPADFGPVPSTGNATMATMLKPAVLAAAALFLAGCGSPAPEPKRQEAKRTPPFERPMPAVYKVRFETTQGGFVAEIHKDWAPLGAERFWKLLSLGFFDKNKIFRVRPNFIVQWGISPDLQANQLFNALPIKDDPVKQSNKRGAIAFATSGPGQRRTQVFINLKDNKSLDSQGFAPIGRVVEGMDIVGRFYSGYGEVQPRGTGPDPNLIQTQGDAYLEAKFPRLDAIRRAVVIE